MTLLTKILHKYDGEIISTDLINNELQKLTQCRHTFTTLWSSEEAKHEECCHFQARRLTERARDG